MSTKFRKHFTDEEWEVVENIYRIRKGLPTKNLGSTYCPNGYYKSCPCDSCNRLFIPHPMYGKLADLEFWYEVKKWFLISFIIMGVLYAFYT